MFDHEMFNKELTAFWSTMFLTSCLLCLQKPPTLKQALLIHLSLKLLLMVVKKVDNQGNVTFYELASDGTVMRNNGKPVIWVP